jgi:hypothetical protein
MLGDLAEPEEERPPPPPPASRSLSLIQSIGVAGTSAAMACLFTNPIEGVQ